MWRLLSASVVLLLVSNLVNGQTNTTSTGGFLADEIPLEISTAIPSSLLSEDSFSISGQPALTVVFSRPVIALGSDFGLEELPPELVPFTLTPSIPGRGRWVTTFIYRFDPDEGLATDLDIEFRWNLGLRTYDGVPLTLDSPETVILQTYSLTMRITDVSSAQAEEATDNNWSGFVGTSRDIRPEVPPDGIISLRFSAPVSLAALQGNLKVRDVTRDRVSAIRPVVARCRSTRSAQNDESTCATVTLTEELEMGIRYALFMEAGVDYGTASGPLRRGVSDDFGGLRDFYIPFRDFSYVSITTPFLNLYLPHGLAEGTNLADIPISITDDSTGQRITFNLTQLTKSVYLIEAPLMPLENYTIAVQASDAIRDGFGLPLNGSGANLRGRDVFGEFRGMEPRGFPTYGVFEADEDWGRLAVTFAKGLAENDNGLCEEGSVSNIWRISQPETGIWMFDGSSRRSYDQLLGPPTASLVSTRVDPIATLATLDLVPLLENASGVGTQYCRFDRFIPALFIETFFQAVVVSNRASSESDAALTVWVTSMVTGLPVEGANVFLLQYYFDTRSPELLAEGRTDLDGIAKIPRTRTITSLMVVVRVGSKFLYIPGASFDTFTPRTYDSSIIIDRALFRPGETLSVKGYVMQREGNEYVPATGLTRPRLIISPPIPGISSLPVELSEEFGSYEAQIEVPEDTDLARYSVNFSGNRGNTTRVFYGESAFFTVGDPRLPTIELVPDTPFFVRPDEDIEFSVQVTSFIGSAVGGSNVSVEWSISDLRRDDEEEPLRGELVIITDDTGNGTAVIELSQFEVPPSLGTAAGLQFQLVGPTGELIEEQETVGIEAADLSVSLERTVETDIPGQPFGAALTVRDLRGDPLTADNSVDSATIYLKRAPPDIGPSRTFSIQPLDTEVFASCDYVVDSGEYCDFAIPETGEFVLEGCVRQGDVQLCTTTFRFGETDEYWERTPLRQFLPVGFEDETPGSLAIGDSKKILIENPYIGAYVLVSWGNVERIEQEVKPLEQGRPTVEVEVPAFCELNCRLSLVIAIPRQTKGLASNVTVPVSLLFDPAMPHTVTYQTRIEVLPTGPTDISVDISFPEARTDEEGTAVVAPGDSTSIEVQVDREQRTEITVIAVDRAVLELLPYPLQNITLDFLIDLATTFTRNTVNRNLVAPRAIQALIDAFNQRKDIDPWFSLSYELEDYTRIDRSLEEYIDYRSQFITVSYFGANLAASTGAPEVTFFALSTDSVTGSGASAANKSTSEESVPPIQVRSTASDRSISQVVRLESEFQTTPLFITEVAEDGVTRVNFTAPANLGTFIVRAYAASGTGLFGSAESEVIVRREVSLTPSVPRFARVGDVFEAGAVVTVSGSTIVPISLSAEIEGPLEFLVPSSIVVEVGGDGQEEARFLVRATKIGTANFTLVADDGQGNTDALQVEIPIQGLQEAVTVGSSFVVQGDASGAFTEGLDLPAAVPGSGDIAITAGVGRQPAVLAVSRQILVRNPLLLCPLSADFIVALAVMPGVVNPYSPWNPDPEIISPALVEQINNIVPRFEDAVEQLAIGGNFTSNRLGLRSYVPCPDNFFTPTSPSLSQNTRAVFMVNLVEQNLINHELEEVQSTAEALFEARDVWRGVLAAQLEELAIERRRGYDEPISLYTVAQALAALGPDWTPQTSNATIIDDLSLDRLSRNLTSLGIESQAYYILTRLAQANGSAHPDIPRAVESWTNLFRVTGRTAYISAFSGATYPASDLANALVFLAFTRAGEEGQLIPRLGSYIAAPVSDNYGFNFYGSYAQVLTMQALVEFDVSRGSAQPNLTFEARSGNTTILEASFLDSTPPVASATILWEDLPPRPAPIEVSAVGEGEAFVAVTLNFIPAEILPFPSYRGIYVQRSIQLEDGEQGDGPGLSVVPRGTVVTIKVQFLTPDALDETVVRVLMPAGLEPIDPNISPSGSSRFCPIPFYRSFSFFYGSCPVQETRPSVITVTYSRVNPGTSSVTFRAVAATVGTYTLPPTRVFVSDQPEVMGLSSGGQFEVCAGPDCQTEFLEPSPPPVDCVDDCNNSGTCNLSNGSCLCFSGFTGSACESTI